MRLEVCSITPAEQHLSSDTRHHWLGTTSLAVVRVRPADVRLRGRGEVLPVSRSYLHVFRQM